jgi:hypothetical protein
MARLDFKDDLSSLSLADQSLVLGLALHLKRTRQEAEFYQS